MASETVTGSQLEKEATEASARSKSDASIPSRATARDTQSTASRPSSQLSPSTSPQRFTSALADYNPPRSASSSSAGHHASISQASASQDQLPLSRRPSGLTSTRPAPPSPGPPSRRASGTITTLGSSGAGGSNQGAGRDRAGSASSNALSHSSLSTSQSGVSTPVGAAGASASTRRVSHSSNAGNRNSSRPRPRSSLGTAMYTGSEHDAVTPEEGLNSALELGGLSSSHTPESVASPSLEKTGAPSQLAAVPVPEEGIVETASDDKVPTAVSPKEIVPSKPPRHTGKGEMYIRDFGFPSTDDKHLGLGKPAEPSPNSPSASRLSGILFRSASGSRRPSAHNDPSGGGGGNGGAGDESRRGWTGFSFWRGFMRKPRSSSQSQSGSRSASASAEEDIDADDEFGEPIDHTDDYAFESGDEGSDDDEDDEPVGLYRAAYAFQAEGEHEMGVEEGEVLDVKGRGGEEGWVVAVRIRLREGDEEVREGEVGSLGDRLAEDSKEDNNTNSSGSMPKGPKGGTSNPTSPSLSPDLAVDELEEGLVPESYLERVEDDEYVALVHAVRSRQGSRDNVASSAIQGGLTMSTLSTTQARKEVTLGQMQKTVSPDGISEEPEEVSDLESEIQTRVQPNEKAQ